MCAGLHDPKAIFLEALGHDSPGHLDAFLDEACGSNFALRARVEELLRAHHEAGRFLGKTDPLDATLDVTADGPGAAIGPYRLLEQIGEGGFGVVYLAEQQAPIRRRVALKILKPGMDTRQVVARFEAERQVLAILDHPHIAKVLDAGQTASGRPYFVMDLVDGVPITEYCDGNRLALRDRLSLFVDVCRAVQHAHQKGVIHRDLKPSNVLVTVEQGAPLVKIIDFGIAKALGRQVTERTLVTGFAQLIGTPQYMSPEQAGLGELDVDTRSDIYSLGVLLYELLTETTPFEAGRFARANYDEIRRIVREEEPPKPSTRLSTPGPAAEAAAAQRQCEAGALAQMVRGELDWIVMKAIEKDRDRRYESANALAADVERYLRDEPVTACPPSTWYRWRKLARRHRSELGMLAVVIAALGVVIAAIAGSVGWAARDRQARDAALDETVLRTLAEAQSLAEAAKWPDAKAAADRAETLLSAAGRRARPPRLAELRRDLAMAVRLEEIYNQPTDDGLAFRPHAGRDYEQAFRDYGIDIVAMPVSEAADHIRQRSIRLELARALDFWAISPRYPGTQSGADRRKLIAVAQAADPDRWRNWLRQAVERDDGNALAALASSPEIDTLPPQTLASLGRAIAERRGDGSDSSALDARAVDFLTRAQRRNPGDLWINSLLAHALCALKRDDEGISFYTAAVALRPRSPFLAFTLGLRLQQQGRDSDAIALYSRAIELDPNVYEVWLRRGMLYRKVNQLDRALADLTRALEFDSPSTTRGIILYKRGSVHERQRRWDRAFADYSDVIEKHPQVLSADGDDLVQTRRAYVCSMLGRWDTAAADLDFASGHARALDNDVWCQLACARILAGDEPGYRRVCEQLARRAEQTNGAASGQFAYIVGRTCLMHPTEAEDRARGERWAAQALATDPHAARYQHVMALAHYRSGRFEQAAQLARQCDAAPITWDGVVPNWLLLAMAYHQLGQRDEALEYLNTIDIWRRAAATGASTGDAPFPPDLHLTNLLALQLLDREAEALFDPSEREAVEPTPERAHAAHPPPRDGPR